MRHLLLCLALASGCAHEAKLELAVRVPTPRPEPAPVPIQAPPKLEEPAPPPLVEATTTGAEIDVPGVIEFERDKAQLHHATSGTRDTLDKVLAILKANPSITKVRIEGHTDSDGTEAMNQYLSDHRAQAVLAWLVGNGIDADRLAAVGCAARDPLVPNTSEANKQRNRRTEFDIEVLDGKQPRNYTTPCAPNPDRKP